MPQDLTKIEFKNQNLHTLLTKLEEIGSTSRIIGGAVRDKLLGIDTDDIDIATDLEPIEVTEKLKKYSIKTIPTGIKFGTITALINDQAFEITTLRSDIKCNGRHAEVTFTKNFEEDASRRDFTINALSYCPVTHKIYDYHNGISDLRSKIVRFIGDPKQRISEDYLRILRFFRFSEIYASDIDKEGFAACKAAQDKLTSLPRERINQEIDKWLTKGNNTKILQNVVDSGFHLFEDLEISNLSFIQEYPDNLALTTKYAMIFLNNDEDKLRLRLQKMLFSKNAIRTIMNLHKIIRSMSFFESWINNNNVREGIIACFAMKKLSLYDSSQLLKEFDANPPKMPVNGNDLINLGLAGREIGERLTTIKSAWINSKCTLSKEWLINNIH